jgi:hypothetical protein
MTDQHDGPARAGRPMKIMASEFYATLTAVFAMGALVGWGLFGTELQLINRAWGSVAEWLAAVGTTVVGLGAWKYARETHLHRVDEARASDQMRRRKAHALIAGVLDASTSAIAILHSGEDRGALDPATITKRNLTSLMRVARVIRANLKWPSLYEIPADAATVEAFAWFDVSLVKYFDFLILMENALAHLQDADAIGEDLQEMVATMVEIASEGIDKGRTAIRALNTLKNSEELRLL